MQRPAPGSPAACHTCAAVHHKTSPTLAPRSPGRFVHSPIPPGPESPSDEFVLSRCDAAQIHLTVIRASRASVRARSEEHTSELQSRLHLVCRLLLDKKK